MSAVVSHARGPPCLTPAVAKTTTKPAVKPAAKKPVAKTPGGQDPAQRRHAPVVARQYGGHPRRPSPRCRPESARRDRDESATVAEVTE